MQQLQRISTIVHIALLGAAVIAAVLLALFISISPIAFQRASAIVVAPEPVVDWEAESPVLDVRRVIGAIPYRSSEVIYEVLPERLYERAILGGRGNCANKVRGLTVFLNRADIPFQRIDIAPVDGFLFGKGHVLLRTKYELDGVTRVGIIDVLEGSLLAINGEFVDLPRFRTAQPFTIEMVPMSSRADQTSDYYGTFLQRSVISTTPPGDTRRYFEFINSIYMPLGVPRFERIFYNGLAVLAGYFPRLCVSQADYNRLFGEQMYIVYAAGTLRWSLRAIVLLAPAAAALAVARRFVRRREVRSDARPAAPAPSAASTTMG